MKDIISAPQFIQFNDSLTGYDNNLDLVDSNKVVLFFGGSNYIAYNSVGKFSSKFNCPFISADYYGTQGSKGNMNIKSMKQQRKIYMNGQKGVIPLAKL
ncbi:MAG TPA: hypothetical protein VIL23_05400 [Clostridia bacterium]